MTPLDIGDKAWIYWRRFWYRATITRATAVRVWVTYTTGSGVRRERPYNRQSRLIQRRFPGGAPPVHNPHRAPDASGEGTP